MNVLDVAQNSVAAGAKLVQITLEADEARDTLLLAIEDDGHGMTSAAAQRAADPFYTTRTTRKVGLGLPFLKMAAEMTGGGFSITSQPGRGTRVCAQFGLHHIDRAPLGDMASTIAGLIQCSPDIDFVYTVRAAGGVLCRHARDARRTGRRAAVRAQRGTVDQGVYRGEHTAHLRRSNII